MGFLLAIFNVIGILYCVSASIFLYKKGLIHVVWLVILAIATTFFEVNPETDVYFVNEELVPIWIFNPDCFLAGLVVALGMNFALLMYETDKQTEG